MEGTDRRVKIALPMPHDDAVKYYYNYFNAFEALGNPIEDVWGPLDPGAYDGLLLPGGGDVNPCRYGQAMLPECGATDDALDEYQFNALSAFLRAGKPVLGVCRGCQLINVYFGGTLIQHLPSAGIHRFLVDDSLDTAHDTRALPDCTLAAMYGERFPVNSNHHQAIDRLGEGIEAVQWSDDGVIEGIRHSTLPVYGVQWHPERMCFKKRREDTVDGSILYRWFIDLCAGRGRR